VASGVSVLLGLVAAWPLGIYRWAGTLASPCRAAIAAWSRSRSTGHASGALYVHLASNRYDEVAARRIAEHAAAKLDLVDRFPER
jgi:hypothetical protein